MVDSISFMSNAIDLSAITLKKVLLIMTGLGIQHLIFVKSFRIFVEVVEERGISLIRATNVQKFIRHSSIKADNCVLMTLLPTFPAGRVIRSWVVPGERC